MRDSPVEKSVSAKLTPFELGTKAAADGLPISDNPYARCNWNENWWEWRRGHDYHGSVAEGLVELAESYAEEVNKAIEQDLVAAANRKWPE